NRVVGLDPDHGARLGTAYPGQRHWTRSHIAEPSAEPRGIRQAMRYNAVASWHQPRGDCGGAALHPVGTGDDRSDDRPRRGAASRVGAIAAPVNYRVGVRAMRERDVCLTTTLTRGFGSTLRSRSDQPTNCSQAI